MSPTIFGSKLSVRGKRKSAVEILNVGPAGIWIFADEHEYFAPFDQFPWFRDAKIGDILNVERPYPGHLYWPTLDIDLAVASLAEPEKFPRVAKAGKRKR